jgi:GT2 family glycosyltransferase
MNRKQRRTQAAHGRLAQQPVMPNRVAAAAAARPETIRFVVATRESRDSFATTTAIGRSLSLYQFEFVQLRLFEQNTRGLPEVYNLAIEEAKADPAILVFVHDDVHLLDYFWAERVLRSLDRFQLIGLAGNKRRVPRQPSWAFVDDKLTWDQPENLSGVVGHGKTFPPSNLSIFGAPGQEVKLLDGLMLAARSKTLVDNSLRFDEAFDFHFYDLDICRQAELKGVSMGTFALPVIHESGGNFGSEGWRRGYERYLEKWKS